MRHNYTYWDGLDYAIVRFVEERRETTIPAVMREIDPTIPEGTIRNRVRRLAAHGVIESERGNSPFYVLRPGAGLEMMA